MQIWDTVGMQLTASGYGAPSGDQLISAELTYGGVGSCQSGTLRPIDTFAQGRDSEWVVGLSGYGPVFRGIPDSISDGDGQLAQVGLMPSHRPRLDAPGTSLAGIQAGEFETLSTALQRELGSKPDADIGITASGAEVAQVPSGGGVYTLDSRAYGIRYIGPTYPDAVTDAIFDPGEGWKKYKYHRDTPPYALRKTATATADPVTITKQDTNTLVGRVEAGLPPVVENGVTHSFNNLIECDNVERTYGEGDSTATEILSDTGVFAFGILPNTNERRNTKIRVRCPFYCARILPYPLPAHVVFVPVPPSTIGGTLTPISGGLVVGIGTADKMTPPPPPLNSSPTMDDVAKKVSEQNNYLGVIKGQTDTITNLLTQARSDLTNLVQRVNAIGANTTDSNGNLTNLADELAKTQAKLNTLGDSVQALDKAQRTPRNTPKKGELKLLVTLSLFDPAAGTETSLSTQTHIFKEQDIGLELAFEFVIDQQLDKGPAFKLRYELVEQDTGRSIVLTFRPIEVVVDYETPNVEAVKMPDGWDRPFRTAPRFEFRLPGWHMPPLYVQGLPGGYAQMAASATVTWNRNECSTLITTAALGYR